MRTRGAATRQALLEAGLELFGQLGYHAASSRALAQTAGVNQALIGYHFGGKQGLYLAVFAHIAEELGMRIQPIAASLEEQLSKAPRTARARDELRETLLTLFDRYVELFARPESSAWAMLIVREQQSPSEAFELLWDRVLSRTLRVVTRVVGALRGQRASTRDVRILVLTMIGQILVFRVAHTAALRELSWTRIGPREISHIQSRIRRNAISLLSREDQS